jgi:hypothetical protein
MGGFLVDAGIVAQGFPVKLRLRQSAADRATLAAAVDHGPKRH